jgi:peptidoglycan/xylan/chitin deacetylase (PgdA/CDA1 family)
MLILTYHAVESGPSPLCIEPDIFRQHLEVIADLGAATLTVSELAAALARGELAEPAVAITFDDGFESVYEHAAPLLAERGQRATVFAVAGSLGGLNDWPSQQVGAPQRPLLHPTQLVELSQLGFEVGSHGVEHAPMAGVGADEAEREVVTSKEMLEELLGCRVATYAYPYGASPSPHAARLVRSTYDAACGTRLATVGAGVDPHDLPRVDSHYVRRPELLRRALAGSLRGYLMLRRAGARSRRLARKDYRQLAPAGARPGL